MLEHNSVVPLYFQVKENIQADILSGKLKEKEKLPSITALSARYGVSVITVRRAIFDLSNEGLLEMKQGKGTYVSAPKISRSIKKMMSFTEMCKANGLTAGAKMLSKGIVVPHRGILARLQQQLGSKVVEIIRLRLIGGSPCVIERNHFPIEYDYLLSLDLENRSLYDCLRDRIGEFTKRKMYLEICRANEEEARLLEVELNAPLLRMVGDIFETDKKMLHVCTQVGFGEKFRFYVDY